jgi:hypothetical protein
MVQATSNHLKSRQDGNQNRFSNAVQMVTSLKRFGMNKIFVMTLSLIKHTRLVRTIRKPDKFVWFSNALAAILHSKTGQICPVFEWFGRLFV